MLQNKRQGVGYFQCRHSVNYKSKCPKSVKQVILLTHQQLKELKNLLKIQATLGTSKLKLNLSYALLYGLIKKTMSKDIKIDIETQKEEINQIKEQTENYFVKLDIDFDLEIEEKLKKSMANLLKLSKT